MATFLVWSHTVHQHQHCSSHQNDIIIYKYLHFCEYTLHAIQRWGKGKRGGREPQSECTFYEKVNKIWSLKTNSKQPHLPPKKPIMLRLVVSVKVTEERMNKDTKQSSHTHKKRQHLWATGSAEKWLHVNNPTPQLHPAQTSQKSIILVHTDLSQWAQCLWHWSRSQMKAGSSLEILLLKL